MRRDKDYSTLRDLATQSTVLVSGLLPPGYLSIILILDNTSLYMSTALAKDEAIQLLHELLEKLEEKESPYEH